MPEKLCHCGLPLHYQNKETQDMIQGLVDKLGEYVTVIVDGGSYRVPRHYIALHGIKASEIERLGFEKVRSAPTAKNRSTR